MAEMAAGVYLLRRWRPACIDGGVGGRHVIMAEMVVGRDVIADNALDDAQNSLANIICMYSF